MTLHQRSAVFTATLVVTVASLFSSATHAQTYPNKPVTIIAAAPVGGALDFVGRLFAKEMSVTMGQQVNIENAPGAGGTLGTNKAMRAPADGYTLTITSPIESIFAPLAYNAAQYKPEDSKAILNIGRTNIMLVTRKDLPVNNLGELIALMKSRGDKQLSYCSPGNGSLYHLIAERLNTTANVKSLHVPYNGFAQCLTDLIGGTTIDFAFLPLAGPFPGAVDGGKFKAISMLSSVPSNRFPNVAIAPATKGFEGFVFSVWAGLHVSGNVPEAVAEVINKHANAALAKPELRTAIEQTGSVLSAPMTLKQAQDDYLREVQLYTAMFKASGLPKQ